MPSDFYYDDSTNGAHDCSANLDQAPLPFALDEKTKTAVREGWVNPVDFGFTGSIRSTLALRNPARRAVYKILGIYLPEREARDMLRKIHEYKWIEAEKAGFDIWQKRARDCGFSDAATRWAKFYLRPYLTHKGLMAA